MANISTCFGIEDMETLPVSIGHLMIKVIGKNAYGNDWNHTSVQAGLDAWIGKLADGDLALRQPLFFSFDRL